MIEVMFAILAAAFWGLALVFVRKGLMESNYISAAFIITIIGNIVFWTLTLLLVPLKSVNPLGVLLFALAGMLAPGLARISSFLGMERLGASVNGSIIATFPLFSSTAAIILLHEQPTDGTLVGTLCVVCGAMLVGRIHNNNVKSGESMKMGIVFSLSTSITAGLAYSVRKMGLIIYNEPILGIALGYAMAFSIYTLMIMMSRNMRSIVSVNRHTFQIFWKAGLFMCLGWVMSFYAVLYGDVVIVGPLMNTEPLFIFLFAYMYLRELETVTFKLILGSLIIILGVALLSMPSTIFLISF